MSERKKRGRGVRQLNKEVREGRMMGEKESGSEDEGGRDLEVKKVCQARN